MPIYEYWCTECKAGFEKLSPIASKDADISCPRCGSRVKRMLSVVAAVGAGRSTDEGYSPRAGSGGGCACGGSCGCGGHN